MEHAGSQETAKRLLLYHVFIPELADLHFSRFSEKHYNQVVSLIILITAEKLLDKSGEYIAHPTNEVTELRLQIEDQKND